VWEADSPESSCARMSSTMRMIQAENTAKEARSADVGGEVGAFGGMGFPRLRKWRLHREGGLWIGCSILRDHGVNVGRW